LVPVQTGRCCGPKGGYVVTVGDQAYESDPIFNDAGMQMLAFPSTDLSNPVVASFGTGGQSNFDAIEKFLNARTTGDIIIISPTKTSGIHNAELGALLQGNKTTPGFGANAQLGVLDAAFRYTFIGVKGFEYDQGWTLATNPDYTGYFV